MAGTGPTRGMRFSAISCNLCHVAYSLWPEENMRNEFTAIIEQDGEWYIAYCPEIPGANGQGRTIEECRKNLADAITLILEDRREDALRGAPEDAIRETVLVQ